MSGSAWHVFLLVPFKFLAAPSASLLKGRLVVAVLVRQQENLNRSPGPFPPPVPPGKQNPFGRLVIHDPQTRACKFRMVIRLTWKAVYGARDEDIETCGALKTSFLPLS